MWFELVKVRKAGVLVPRWQIPTLPIYVGRLAIEEERLRELERTSLVARLILETEPLDRWPRLYDARLLGTSSQWLTLTGFEVDVTAAGAEAHLAQTWLLTPVAR